MSVLTCPNCGETEAWATVERLHGRCDIVGPVTDLNDLNWGGYTDMWWDDSVSIGLYCTNCLDFGLQDDEPDGVNEPKTWREKAQELLT